MVHVLQELVLCQAAKHLTETWGGRGASPRVSVPGSQADSGLSTLATSNREELLQAVLVAASRGDDALIGMLEELCLVYAGRQLVRGCTELPSGLHTPT